MKPSQSTIWQKIPGWLVKEEADYLYKIASELNKDDIFVEIGTYMGRSAAAIGMGCIESGARCVSVDHFRGNKEHTVKPSEETARIWLQRVHSELPGVVNIVAEDGIVFSWQFKKPYHAVFLDCEHSYQDTLDMFTAWWPRLASKGHVLFHDAHNSGWNEVINVVNDIEQRWPLEFIGTADSIKHFRKAV